jgi:hypothetical protein
MNCYYSNLIEGHNTLPIDIDRALNDDLAKEPERRNLQLEARAHIEVQLMIDRREAPSPEARLCLPPSPRARGTAAGYPLHPALCRRSVDALAGLVGLAEFDLAPHPLPFLNQAIDLGLHPFQKGLCGRGCDAGAAGG